jgi:hypothetical protein
MKRKIFGLRKHSIFCLKKIYSYYHCGRIISAEVAELADARDLKSSRKKNGLIPLSTVLPSTY